MNCLSILQRGDMTERPEYINCIRETKTKTICGRDIGVFEWVFLDIAHACAEIAQSGRLVPCPECFKTERKQ